MFRLFLLWYLSPAPLADVLNYDSYGNLVEQVSNIVEADGLNVLLNNAGIASRSTRLEFVKSEDLSTVFETNAVAPVMLTKVRSLHNPHANDQSHHREMFSGMLTTAEKSIGR